MYKGTWISLHGKCTNQIDQVIIDQKHLKVRSYRGADANSGLLKVELKLEKAVNRKIFKKQKKSYNMEMLQDKMAQKASK